MLADDRFGGSSSAVELAQIEWRKRFVELAVSTMVLLLESGWLYWWNYLLIGIKLQQLRMSVVAVGLRFVQIVRIAKVHLRVFGFAQSVLGNAGRWMCGGGVEQRVVLT